MRILTGLLFALCLLAGAGCRPQTPARQEPGSAAGLPALETPERTAIPMKKPPERIPPTPPTEPVTGEVPEDLLQAIIRDLSQKTGAEAGAITVARAEAVTWNDGSLGCPQPGMMYTQSIVSGYWVVLTLGEKEYDYRASQAGYFLQCEKGLPPIRPQGTPSS